MWWTDSFWNEFEKQMWAFRKQMEGLNKTAFAGLPMLRAPASNIREEDGNLVIELDMPGVKKEDIHIVATEHSIEAKAQRKELKVEKRKGFASREVSARSYYQLLPMPATIKPNTIKTEYENGVLKLIAEKKEVKKEEKKIKVKVK